MFSKLSIKTVEQSEAVHRRYSTETIFWKSQESTCVRVSFLIKLQFPEILLRRYSYTDVFQWILENNEEQLFYATFFKNISGRLLSVNFAKF